MGIACRHLDQIAVTATDKRDCEDCEDCVKLGDDWAHLRQCLERYSELGDAASADILTEIVRGVDKWL